MIYRDFGKAGFQMSAIGLGTHSTGIALAAVKSGTLDVLMFPVNPLFKLLPQDSADARMKGREARSMTQAERDRLPRQAGAL